MARQFRSSSALAPDDEAHLYLVSIVDNELVAAHATRRVIFDLPHRHFDVAFEPFASRRLGSSYAYCVSAVASGWKTACIVVRMIQGSRRSTCNLAKHKGSDTIADLRAGISKRLSNQVGEVDSFAEKMASNWCLRWRDAHSLREDTHEIGKARSVPKQLLIAEIVRIVDSRLSKALHLEAVDNIEVQVLLRCVQIPLNHLIGGTARL